ncbi:MAG: protein translocase subunit SecD [Candidatus Aminicenantes bacterium]|nr:protein translocase subunit SecD [Candidatus Aminicenantes bacterium]
MKRKLRWKIILVIGVVALAVFLAYPPAKKINLGLDLRGGMHLQLQVITDDSVRAETDQEVSRLRQKLEKENIAYEAVVKTEGEVDQFIIQQIDPEKQGQVREILDEEYKQWSYRVMGDNITMTMNPGVATYLREQAVRQSLETIGNRVDELGLTEPTIQRQGLTGERIIVELPGVENPERVIEILKTTAQLEFRLVKGGPAPDKETLLEEYGGEIPAGMEVLRGDPQRTQGEFYLVSDVAEIVGKDLRNARRSTDEWNNPAVSFTLNPDASKRFAKLTEENIGKPLSTVLDSKIQLVATIEDRIPGSGIIRGRYTPEEAEDIALVLRAGALPASIEIMENRTIGPSLGADSIRKGIRSIVMALILIMIFMVFYYRMSGVNAVVALILNIIIIGGVLAYFKANLTLPGMAGIILTVGMAVDANVLVFERIREELSQGKSVLSSIASGFSRAFRTILDANITTIIAAVFLFQFGTGPIKGFAVTLIIGITASMFTAVFVSRLIFDLTVGRKKKKKDLSI